MLIAIAIAEEIQELQRIALNFWASEFSLTWVALVWAEVIQEPLPRVTFQLLVRCFFLKISHLEMLIAFSNEHLKILERKLVKSAARSFLSFLQKSNSPFNGNFSPIWPKIIVPKVEHLSMLVRKKSSRWFSKSFLLIVSKVNNVVPTYGFYDEFIISLG